MGSSEFKHIGIWMRNNIPACGISEIWHYANGSDKVISQTKEDFVKYFDERYKKAGDSVEYYYGVFGR